MIFSKFQDEMQYNYFLGDVYVIIMDVLAIIVAETDVILVTFVA